MASSKADIIARLHREILPLQGFKPLKGAGLDVGLGSLRHAFPNHVFPLGAIHEFINHRKEDLSASGAFIGGILSVLMRNEAVCIWISTKRTIFPAALHAYGIAPDKMIFIDLKNEKQVLWAMEEALKCKGLAAVVGEIKEIDFTVSRRLQLAVEQSRVTGFILRNNPKSLSTTACIARWQITSLPSQPVNGTPGVGHQRWNIELTRIRNGKPGNWQVEWSEGRFQLISHIPAIELIKQKKTG